MADFPFFLRECNKYPPSTDLNSQQEPRTTRAFELAVSLETLLEIDDAAELLFESVDYNHKGDIIWLCADTYITRGYHPENSIYAILTELYNNTQVCICHIPSTAVTSQRTTTPADSFSSSASLSIVAIGTVVDILLQLLAKHNTINYIEIYQVGRREVNANESFPASLDALKTLVSKERYYHRELRFDGAGLTADQWRVVHFHCNKKVTLFINEYTIHDNNKLEALIDAMYCNSCHARLELHAIQCMPKGIFHRFLLALQSNTSLKDLKFSYMRGDHSILTLLCEAISRNAGLQRLHLSHCKFNRKNLPMSDSEWEYICHALASHSTLESLEIDVGFEKRQGLSPERDQRMIRYVSNNKVLRYLTWGNGTFLHKRRVVEQVVEPFLVLNRCRPAVNAIKKETDLTRRKIMFSIALGRRNTWLHRCPSCRFWLFKENVDLLAKISWPKRVFLARRERLMGRNAERGTASFLA